MSLLREIQNGAVGTETPVSVLLRQCLVLAARLQHSPLRDWAQLELNGYADDVDLPPYRPKLRTHVVGNFSGPFQSSISNQGLAEASVPEEYRDRLFWTEIRGSVAELETLVQSGESRFEIQWPTDAVAAFQDRFLSDMNLMGARQIVPATVFVGALSGIRDRIVHFALEIELIDPDAGEAEPGDPPIEQARVTQIFNQTFHGDNTAIAAAGRDAQQSQSVSVSRDVIVSTLDSFGVATTDRDLLLAAAVEEGVFDGAEPGERTRAWVAKLEKGAIKLGAGTSSGVAAAVISSLLGIR